MIGDKKTTSKRHLGGRKLSETVRLAVGRRNNRRKSNDAAVSTTSITSSMITNYFDVDEKKKKQTKRRDLSIESIRDMISENFGVKAIECVPRSLLQTLLERMTSSDRTIEESSSLSLKSNTSKEKSVQQSHLKKETPKFPMRGTLWKRGGRGLFGGGMKQRHFVLDGERKEIRYYRHNPDIRRIATDTRKNLLGTIRLQEAVAITSSSDGVSFDIHTGKRIWYLKALSQSASNAWISAITELIPHIMTNIETPTLETQNVLSGEDGETNSTNLKFHTMTSKVAFGSSDDWYSCFFSLPLSLSKQQKQHQHTAHKILRDCTNSLESMTKI